MTEAFSFLHFHPKPVLFTNIHYKANIEVTQSNSVNNGSIKVINSNFIARNPTENFTFVFYIMIASGDKKYNNKIDTLKHALLKTTIRKA